MAGLKEGLWCEGLDLGDKDFLRLKKTLIFRHPFDKVQIRMDKESSKFGLTRKDKSEYIFEIN